LRDDFKLHIEALRGDRAEGHLASATAKNLRGGGIDDGGTHGRRSLSREKRGKKEEKEENDLGKAMRVGFPVATLFERRGRSAVIDRRYNLKRRSVSAGLVFPSAVIDRRYRFRLHLRYSKS
jgi:hypothetical protein